MAKSIEDLRKYWQEIASKAGLSDEQVAAMDQALGDESVVKAFRQGFVPVPEHHSTLDELRKTVDSRRAELDDWYKNTALPAYQTNLNGIERLRQYESLYGDLDPNAQPAGTGFRSKEELDRYLDDKLRAQQAGFVGLAKVTPKLALDYYSRFKEVLDLDEVEKLAVKEGLPPDLAYQRYIAPKVEAQQKVELEAKLKEARDAGAREAISKYHLPVDTTPRESSPFYDREAAPEKPRTATEEDRASRQSFMDGWNNYAENIANRNRS